MNTIKVEIAKNLSEKHNMVDADAIIE